MDGPVRSYRNFGGRCLDDIEQFWFSVGFEIKSFYPINGVPKDIEEKYDSLRDRAVLLVKDGAEFLETLELESP